MRNFLITAGLLTTLALAQSGPFTTFDCAIYGSQVQLSKDARVDVWTKSGRVGSNGQVGNNGQVGSNGRAVGVGNQGGGVTINRKDNSVVIGNEAGTVNVNPDGTVQINGQGGTVQVNQNGTVDINGQGGKVQVDPDQVRINSADGSSSTTSSYQPGLVQQGADRILPAVDPSRLSPSGPNHRLEKSQEMYLKPGSYGTLDGRNSARFILAAGEYRIENLELHNSADVDLDGPVVLYIGKSLSVQNSAELNAQGRPSDLVVYQAEPNRPINVIVSNSAMAHMALCGPTAAVHLRNNAGVYGSVIAKQVELDQQAQLHYDPALSNVKIRR
jgi:hypothetical protein